MQRIKISIILILVAICSHGQLTQSYKNGLFAATDKGLYYLQDGFNEWLQLSSDTCIAVSVNNDVTYQRFHRGAGNIYQAYIYANYGYKSKDLIGGTSGNPVTYVDRFNKSFTNRFKYPILAEKNKDMITFSRYGAPYFDNFIESDSIFDLESDGDTILIVVFDDNRMSKYVIDNNNSNVAYSDVTGLTSNTASAHKICHYKDADIFYIASDEGFIYSYDKNTVVRVDTIPDCDSVLCIQAEDVKGYLGVTYRKTDLSINLITVGQAFSYVLAGNAQITNKDSLFVVNKSNEIYTIDPESSTSTQLASLPSGTVVYELKYLDYLPCDRGFYFSLPIANDTLYNDTEYQITWASCKTIGNVYITLYEYINGDYEYVSSIVNDTENDGAYLWTPTGLTDGNNYVLYMEDDYYAYTYSDTFRIQDEPLITVTYPTYGVTLNHGNNYEITWTSQSISGNVKLELFKNDVLISSEITLLPANTANDGSYIWNAAGGYYFPGPFPPGIPEFKIRVTSLATGVYGESELFNLSDNT